MFGLQILKRSEGLRRDLSLRLKMWLLVVLMFGILYGVLVAGGAYFGVGNASVFIVLGILIMAIQYLIGPSLISKLMRIKYVSEKEEPKLHRQVAEMAQRAGIPKPKIGISQISIPNAFAFGRSRKDGRVCVTQGIRKLLNEDELKAVLGHEIAHIKHRDMMIMTLLSVIPLILYWIAFNMMWGGMLRNRREGGNYTVLIGLGAFALYFITNLLILYGSRIREYYADQRSVELGNSSHHLASALYKLVYCSAQAKNTRQGQEELKRVGAIKAFFINDVNRGWNEVNELKEVDQDLSGCISQNELLTLRSKKTKLSKTEKMIEIFTTHPNTLKRIKRLSNLV